MDDHEQFTPLSEHFTATGRTFVQSSPAISASNCVWFMVQLHPSRRNPGQQNFFFLKRLGKQARPAADPQNRLDPIRPTRDILHTVFEARQLHIRSIPFLDERFKLPVPTCQ
ncbi:hypothetical protein ACVIHI_000021 [Bradyrhizobium sp. USDA 4524]|uniref:hypothetical protein n=1 Tax=unclassified Bradyrhizobium TaxID=2631580 RepID=UPI00209D0983|nr:MULTISPECIES: hypothetical protein [unclassified Bradyrhizobium]MCP1838617.1 hypothetical protein [Bradyrhizobium sp. USDA 4538]MCP1899182.1 hypothetical protein [Bradyrhizobium sp. USDA 4537]MCP1986706.1 hypothetical protein [Bradyrhizobium sp. USDA 4539]